MSYLIFSAVRTHRHATSAPIFKTVMQNILRIPSHKATTFTDPIVRGLSDSSRRLVGSWLGLLTGMTFGAVILGGVTRLTESGLSMVDWHLFKEVPPINREAWIEEFEKYKKFPEYEHVIREHGDMSLARFKFIWHMEYGHRQWGRLLGLVYAVPAALFWYKGYFNKVMKRRVLAYGALIGIQGLIGWYMVRSGLQTPKPPVGADKEEEFVGVPRVSHYRLALHLGAATVLYSLFLWSTFSHFARHPPILKFDGLKRLKILTHSTKAAMFVTLIFGAFVAGLDAGLVYNSWPKMADRWVPEDLVVSRYGSTARNLVDNPSTVQFMHRMLAYTTMCLAGTTWALVMTAGLPRTGPRIRNAAHLMLAAALGQSSIGIVTLLNYVPVSLGAIHQGGSLVLFSAILWLSHSLRAVPK